MNKRLCFTSSKFQPLPGEEEKTNPGVFGQALAGWVRDKLNASGHTITEEPIPEDWGWVVMIQRKPFMLWVGCGNETGNSKQWSLFVEAEPGLFQKLLKRVDPSPSVAALEQKLEKIIKAETECTNVEWESV
jgi:hypothetical protein